MQPTKNLFNWDRGNNLAGLIDKILLAFMLLVFARVILTFVIPMSGVRPHPALVSVYTMIVQATEPILGPIRRSLPSFGGLDFSPMVVLIVVSVLRSVI